MRRWREMVLALASIVLALVVAEVGFRLYLRHRAGAEIERVERQVKLTQVNTCNLGDIVRLSRERELFYELKPNLRGRYCGGAMSTNALGMRMPIEPSVEKPAGVVRIAGVGDSYLFGQGVDDGQGFLEVLQAEALAAGKPLEILNFAVPGYNSWMESVVVARRAKHYAPDVILVSITGNDWDLPNFMLSRPYGDVAHSFLLGAIAERLRTPPSLVQTPRSRVYTDHYLAVPEEVPDNFRHMVGFDAYRRALLGMLSVAEQTNAQLVLFSDCISVNAAGSPSCSFPFKPGEYERVREEVYDKPRVTLCPWHLPTELLIPRDGHPTAEGHKSLAAQLRACIEPRGMLPK